MEQRIPACGILRWLVYSGIKVHVKCSMKSYYAKQSQVGTAIKFDVFKSMQERDTWVREHYDVLCARQCSELEAKQIAKPEEMIEH